MDAQEIEEIFSNIDKFISEKNDSKQKEEALFDNIKTNLNRLRFEDNRNENASLKTKMTIDEKATNKEIISDIDKLKVDLVKNEKTINSLNSELNHHRTELSNLKDELKFSMKEMETKNISLNEKDNQIKSLKADISILRNNINPVTNMQNDIKKELSEKKGIVNQKNGEIKLLRNEIEKRNIELNKNVFEIKKLEETIKTNILKNEDFKKINDSVTMLKSDLVEKNAEIKTLRNGIEKKNILIEKQNKNYDNLKSKINRLSFELIQTTENFL